MASLTKKVFDGTFWVIGLRAVQKVFDALRQIILARLLFPEDFGLFGIAALMLLAFEVLTRTGFDDAIIHIQNNLSEYLHTSYWIQVARGIVIGSIVYVGAPLISEFFQ
ncbi:MAG: oligosaccharide flippase family protein [Balneolaceae bacterium]|nr:oligosaccharide flippase family protein [Balneolaceae bacterium]